MDINYYVEFAGPEEIEDFIWSATPNQLEQFADAREAYELHYADMPNPMEVGQAIYDWANDEGLDWQ